MNELEKAIIDTLAYFDIFDYPMTEFEIWKFLYFENKPDRNFTYSEVRKILLENEYLKTKLNFKDGYCFIKGREYIIQSRRRRYGYAERKYMKVMRVIKVLRFFPFIKMIAVCNTLAFNNSRREADIDLFIVTKHNRIWQSRFWVNGVLKIFKMRPSQEKSQDTICSTFFTDEENLNLQKLCINQDDIYLKYWIKQIVPIYDEGVYDKFSKANNWIGGNLPNMIKIMTPSRRRVKNLKFCKMVINILASFCPENIFKNYQMKIMPQGLKDLSNIDTHVIINDHMLKFHDNDRRQIFLDKWLIRRKQLL